MHYLSPRKARRYVSDTLRQFFWQNAIIKKISCKEDSYWIIGWPARDRYRKLIYKIEAALARIDDGSYGYCEDTGDMIGLKRLEARPIATLSIDAQERREIKEKMLATDR